MAEKRSICWDARWQQRAEGGAHGVRACRPKAALEGPGSRVNDMPTHIL